jgi:hypothetical protein
MPDIAKDSNISTASNGAAKYFKIQVRGWTDFDPLDKKLPDIADAIERGGGFLTAIEVLDTKDDLSAIKRGEGRFRKYSGCAQSFAEYRRTSNFIGR